MLFARGEEGKHSHSREHLEDKASHGERLKHDVAAEHVSMSPLRTGLLVICLISVLATTVFRLSHLIDVLPVRYSHLSPVRRWLQGIYGPSSYAHR